mgnify:CR=1 FL=1
MTTTEPDDTTDDVIVLDEEGVASPQIGLGFSVAQAPDIRAGGGQDNLVASFDVSEFNGQSSTGQWTLRVTDNAGIDTGTLASWRLTVITQ